MKASRELTRDVSFRTSIRISTGDSPTGSDWMPYSSMFVQSVYPDRAHLSYRTPTRRAFIRIGQVLYSREDPDSEWVRSESKDWVSIPNNPAAALGIPSSSQFSTLVGDDGSITVRVITKRVVDADEKQTKTSFFVFGSNGILSEHLSIGYNGWSFVRRIEDYEYDPNIKIEAPIK